MIKNIACQSYRDGSICADGFIQKPLCRGFGACPCCGEYSEKSTPNCQIEDLPDHWIKETGEPIFYKFP